MVYLLNPGYAPALKAWQETNRHVPVRVFMDRSAAAPESAHENLSFRPLDAEAAGAGTVQSPFDLDAFLEYLPRHRKIGDRIRDRVRSALDRLLSELESDALGRSLSPSQRARNE